ncbi:hypothetical protein [Salinimicrobium sp. HB62]|uniref:hypothetical protein n=1 Tax=Salinimicrobium sp. HB62 TaxID=3077781 RepID=UPI002D78504D|nr:hypothetical protein [Salinimicrobium sp. HB62]
MNRVYFKEVQKFTQWWIWLSLLGIGVILFYIQSNLGPIILIAIGLLFLSMRLITRIDQNGIHYRFFPFVSKDYSWSEILTARVIDYGFVGGWGIRLFTPYGTVYNVKGSKGLAVELKDGRKFCLGTQRPQELQKVLSGLTGKK